MKRIKVAVLCGGPSSEWEVSMRSGVEIAKHLPKERYDAKLVQIAKDGRWMLLDRKKAVALSVFGPDGRSDKSDLKKFDIAFIALHGAFGEDGKVQAILETIGIPYTGSGILASALGMNKMRAAEIAQAAGIPIPKMIPVERRAMSQLITTQRQIKKELGYPCVVKPNESGSSVGVSIVRKPKDLVPALQKAFKESPTALVQQYIKGRELTCGVLGNSLDGTAGMLTALPPVEIISSAEFFDYDAKYNSRETKEVCPANIPKAVERKVQAYALKAHAALGARGLTRSDFILAKGKLYFLEINTSPGMTEASLCPKEARAIGWTMEEFLDAIARLATVA